MNDKFTKYNPFYYGYSATKHHVGIDDKEYCDRGRGYNSVTPKSMSVMYQNFLGGIYAMAYSEYLTSNIPVYDPLFKSILVAIPTKICHPIVEGWEKDIRGCYDYYVKEGVVVEDYKMSHDNLELNDIQTKKF